MDPFIKFNLDLEFDSFDELSQNTKFNPVTKGRTGAIIVDINDNLVPLVRTTTCYDTPSQKFKFVHYKLIDKIKEKFPETEFNHAHVEIYNSKYKSMRAHSDQSLDLKDNSYICVFSCYDRNTDLRKLLIENKQTREISTITLENNSCVLFSLDVNSQYTHKIILEKNTDNNQWLGITFIMSKTFVHFVEGIPFINDKLLRVATEEEKLQFYKMKGTENRELNYNYPNIDFTLSKGDIINPCND